MSQIKSFREFLQEGYKQDDAKLAKMYKSKTRGSGVSDEQLADEMKAKTFSSKNKSKLYNKKLDQLRIDTVKALKDSPNMKSLIAKVNTSLKSYLLQNFENNDIKTKSTVSINLEAEDIFIDFDTTFKYNSTDKLYNNIGIELSIRDIDVIQASLFISNGYDGLFSDYVFKIPKGITNDPEAIIKSILDQIKPTSRVFSTPQ